MPVGVPKIPFNFPDEEEGSWVELYHVLYRLRVVFLCQAVETEISNQLCGIIAYLTIEDSTKDIFMFVQCLGGGVLPGLALFDMMTVSDSAVYTIAMGYSASMGAFVLSGGDITKRLAFPHARVMIHQPASSFYEGELANYFLDTGEIRRIRKSVIRAYARRTGQSYRAILTGMERDSFMTPEEAQALGIIDGIIDLEY
uniref:ATP-dependent Clp protease proteolytic subunit n=1 Tax=Cleobulia coccinea TaxID=2983343 RepID=UPI00220DBF35|nr:ATP-dependent Clp protease proteolytic subunit [Cleobulia coccinea]UXL85056.1 ATP-dependent Clp protease proteolytic subunit [Cleobulia coccinea]